MVLYINPLCCLFQGPVIKRGSLSQKHWWKVSAFSQTLSWTCSIQSLPIGSTFGILMLIFFHYWQFQFYSLVKGFPVEGPPRSLSSAWWHLACLSCSWLVHPCTVVPPAYYTRQATEGENTDAGHQRRIRQREGEFWVGINLGICQLPGEYWCYPDLALPNNLITWGLLTIFK